MPDKYYIVLEGENSCHRKMESQATSHDRQVITNLQPERFPLEYF